MGTTSLSTIEAMVVDDFLAEYWEQFRAKCQAFDVDADAISKKLQESQ